MVTGEWGSYQLRGRRVTFEYVLIREVTDTQEDAVRLAELSRQVPCKINLIPYNELGCDGCYRRPSTRQIADFRKAVEVHTDVAITIRESRGLDISAACGQLQQMQPLPGGVGVP